MNYTCRKCGIEKILEDFPKADNSRGRKATCRLCYNENYRNYYKNNPEQYTKHRAYVKKNDLVYRKQLYRHSLKEEKFLELLNMYDGKCHSCKEEFATAIDHDHNCCPNSNKSCGECVRGILCNGCNTALGFLKDKSERIQNLDRYLIASKHKATDS
jgi:hypothetical protein